MLVMGDFGFYLDEASGVAPHRQLQRQVRDAIRLGILKAGDQLPTIYAAAADLGVNHNTTMKAYREMHHEGLVVGIKGEGTFVASTVPWPSHLSAHGPLRVKLERWLREARVARLDDETVMALVTKTYREFVEREPLTLNLNRPSGYSVEEEGDDDEL